MSGAKYEIAKVDYGPCKIAAGWRLVDRLYAKFGFKASRQVESCLGFLIYMY